MYYELQLHYIDGTPEHRCSPYNLEYLDSLQNTLFPQYFFFHFSVLLTRRQNGGFINKCSSIKTFPLLLIEAQ